MRLAAGDVGGALAVYNEVWDAVVIRGDHGHASVIAHMAGVAEADPQKKLQWNLDALREAYAAGDHPLVAGFYPSLFSNLGYSYLMLGDLPEALRYMELAASRLGDLEPGPYANHIRSTVEAKLSKLKVT